MSHWVDRILNEFPADLSRLWIAADPDDVLLNEQVLTVLRERGFDVLPFGDSIAFRAEYEEMYRAPWDIGDTGQARALILHLRGTNVSELPWDYLRQARLVKLSLADLFPKLSYSVIRQIGTEHLEALFDSQTKHASQALGEAATKEFVLTHIFRISPHLISRSEDLWRELLRLHNLDAALPRVLAEHVEHVIKEQSLFANLPVAELFESKSLLLRMVQDAWYKYLAQSGVVGTRTGEVTPPTFVNEVDVPFSHPDIRVVVDSMFTDGLLHPLVAQGLPSSIPAWAKIGIVQDPAAMRNLVSEGIKSLMQTLPTVDSSYREWTQLTRRLGELIARFHGLDSVRADGIKASVFELQSLVDARLREWVNKHYADLPSLSVAKGPVMVHHVPRFLSMRRSSGETKIALLVFDGLAVDQWVLIREYLAKKNQKLGFDESACFAWLPTLTSVSRQALFSGMKPREFADSIETTAQEPAQWSKFWLDQGLRSNEVFYRKGIKRLDQLGELTSALSGPAIKVAGMVIDTVDEIVHGAVLGKRGISNQIDSWCESGFVESLFTMLLDKGFHIYVTADHGNVEAVGQGRPNQGVSTELRGERVRTYRSESLAAETTASNVNTYRIDIAGLPTNFIPLFAGGRSAFVHKGEQVVVHGGISVECIFQPIVDGVSG